jgi:ubiquinone/menaquinone biosynthesis C-methylase UbiE
VTHSHYDHYSSALINRLDGPYGAVDARANERIAGYVRGQHVLDLGCGFGSLVDYLATTCGLQAVGIDMLEDQVAAGRARFPAADLRVGDGGLPFPDKSFDTVVLKESLHHLAAEGDVDSTMAEVVRVCRQRIIVFEPNPSIPLRLGRTLISHVDPTCTPAMARAILRSAGLSVASIEYSDALAFPLSGGYVGKPIAGGGIVFGLDRVLLGLFGRHVAWRYLMVADIDRPAHSPGV